MIVRTLNAVMAVLFAIAVAVQYNDPDPARWVALYGSACILSAIAVVRGTTPRLAAGALAVVALGWSIIVIASVRDIATYAHMFDAWEMRSATIEEAREASGLLLTAVWMGVLWIRASPPIG